jgi:hydroxyacylglutathione hydrolase
VPVFTVTPVPAFEDNYIWVLAADGHAVVVDPGDAHPVLQHLKQHGLDLSAILATHHHADHTGGIEDLVSRFSVPVFGPRSEAIPARTVAVVEGDTVRIPPIGAVFEVIEVPGHTRGHVAYYGGNALFCGDTLFACGCGRLFEGSAADMHTSLSRLASLPADTRVFCAHEYTENNLRFARTIEPDNAELAARVGRVREIRAAGLPSLPSILAEEIATNPFLRSREPAVVSAASRAVGRQLRDPVEVFAAIRRLKDRY